MVCKQSQDKLLFANKQFNSIWIHSWINAYYKKSSAHNCLFINKHFVQKWLFINGFIMYNKGS